MGALDYRRLVNTCCAFFPKSSRFDASTTSLLWEAVHRPRAQWHLSHLSIRMITGTHIQAMTRCSHQELNINTEENFASRMIRRMFQLDRCTEGGHPDPASVATLTSVSIISTSGMDEEAAIAEFGVSTWRQRQKHCVSCERVFYTSLATPTSCGSTWFCSLDCKTSFEYYDHLREEVDVQMLGVHTDSFSVSSDEDDYRDDDYGNSCCHDFCWSDEILRVHVDNVVIEFNC